MYKVAIIDDHRHMRERLRHLLEVHYPDMAVVVESFRVSDAVPKLLASPCDIMLLDIELPDGDGFGILEALHEAKVPNFHLILLSQHQYPDYMIQGMNFKARHYLFKPIQPEHFCAAIDLVRREIEAEQKTDHPKSDPAEGLRLRLSDKSIIVLRKSTIIYAQNDRNRCLFYAEDGIWETNKHIGYYDDILAKDPYPFFRIHQSYSINLMKLKKFHQLNKMVELQDGTILPVARRNMPILKDLLGIV